MFSTSFGALGDWGPPTSPKGTTRQTGPHPPSRPRPTGVVAVAVDERSSKPGMGSPRVPMRHQGRPDHPFLRVVADEGPSSRRWNSEMMSA